MAEHAHHEVDELDLDAGDFWIQIESSQGNGTLWDRHLTLSTSGNVANGTILTTLPYPFKPRPLGRGTLCWGSKGA